MRPASTLSFLNKGSSKLDIRVPILELKSETDWNSLDKIKIYSGRTEKLETLKDVCPFVSPFLLYILASFHGIHNS